MVANSSAGGASSAMRLIVRGVAWDIGLPLLTYYVLHSLRASDWVALLAATLVAGARVLFVAVRARRLNAFGLLIMVVFGLGLILTFLTGDPRFLLVKDSITTAVIGGAFLITAVLGHPLTLAALRTWQPDQAATMAERMRTNPGIFRAHRNVSLAWGVGLLCEAAIRIPLIYLLPINVMVGVSATLLVVVLAILIVLTGWYIRHVQPATTS